MSIYILDTETTGLKDPHITEVAYEVIKMVNGKIQVVQDARSKRFNPLKDITFGSMATSHICKEDVEKCAPHTDFILPKSVNYLIGHNIDYDMKAINNTGNTHQPKLICTLAMARFLVPELDSHKLTALLYRFRYQTAREMAHKAHSAIVDIYFTRLILRDLINTAYIQGYPIKTIEDLYNFSEMARIPKYMPNGEYKGKPLSEVPATFKEYLATKTEDNYLKIALEQSVEDDLANHTNLPDTFDFGMNKGKTIKELADDPKGRGYLEWIIEKNPRGLAWVKACELALMEDNQDG